MNVVSDAISMKLSSVPGYWLRAALFRFSSGQSTLLRIRYAALSALLGLSFSSLCSADAVLELTQNSTTESGIEFPVIDNRILIGVPAPVDDLAGASYGPTAERRAARNRVLAITQGLLEKSQKLSLAIDLGTRDGELQELAQAYESVGLQQNAKTADLEKLLFSSAIAFLPMGEMANYIQSNSTRPINEASVSSLSWKGETPFEKLDSAKQFMQGQLPKLLSFSAELPLSFREVTPQQPGNYDFEDKTLRVGGSGRSKDQPIMALYWGEIKTDNVVRLEPEEAERFMSLLQETGLPQRFAYVVTDFSLEPPPGSAGSLGLPIKRVSARYISSDRFGQNKLIDASFAAPELPVTEGGPAGIEPNGPLTLDRDTELLLLLQQFPEMADTVDWFRAMQSRVNEGYDTGDAYPSFGSAHTVNRDVSTWLRNRDVNATELQTAVFRGWTVKRVEALPDDLVVRLRSLNQQTAIQLKKELSSGRFEEFRLVSGQNTDRAYGTNARRQMAETIGEVVMPKNTLLKLGHSGSSSSLKTAKLDAILPGTAERYILPLSDSGRGAMEKALGASASQKRVAIESWLEARVVQVIPMGDASKNATLFAELKPLSGGVIVNGVPIMTVDFSGHDFGPVFQDAGATASASGAAAGSAKSVGASPDASGMVAGAIPSGPYGPELSGIQLGMPMKRALEIVRKKWGVSVEVVVTADPNRNTPYQRAHLIMNSESYEAICLFEDPREGSNRVIGMTRYVPKPAGMLPVASVLASMKSKYGDPVKARSNRSFSWFYADGNITRGKVADGSLFYSLDGKPIERNDLPSPIFAHMDQLAAIPFEERLMGDGKMANYDDSKPGIHVEYESNFFPHFQSMQKMGDTTEFFDVAKFWLFDQRAAAAIYREWKTADSATNANAVDLDL